MPDAGGARLLRRTGFKGHDAATLAVLLACGTAVLTLLGLVSVSAIHVIDRHERRAAAATVHVDPDQAEGTASDLRMVMPELANTRRWAGHDIRREFYAAGTSSEVAPGIPHMPRAGEVYASSDLVRLMAQEPVVGTLFSSYRLVGEIDASGLSQPHELRAIIGVASDRPLLTTVRGFGDAHIAPAAIPEASNKVLDLSIGAYVVALIWIPAGFFVLVIGRLSAVRRARRARALHLMGYPLARIRLREVTETATICLPAIALGCFTFWAASPHVSRVPGTTFGFFPVDTSLAPLEYLSVAAVLLAVMTVATTGVRRALRPWNSHRHRPERAGLRLRLRPPSRTRWRSVVLMAGLVCLGLASLGLGAGTSAALLMWCGTFLVAVGMAVAGPSWVTGLLAQGAENAGAVNLIGRRMASARATPALRLASVMSVIIVLFIGCTSFASILNGGSVDQWERRVAQSPVAPIVATDLVGRLTLADVAQKVPTETVARLSSLRLGDAELPVAQATCRQLHELVGAEPAETGPESCTPVAAPMWIGHAPEGWDPSPAHREEAVAAGVELPPASRVIDLEGLPADFLGALLLPPESLTGTSPQSGASYFMLAPSDALGTTLAALAALEPTMQFDLGPLDLRNPDGQEFLAQIDWLGVGAVLSLAVGLLSLGVVSIAEAKERRVRMRAVRVIGATRAQLLGVHLWCVAVPLVVVGSASIAVGWLVAQAMHRVDERAEVTGQVYGAVAIAVVVVAVAVAAMTWPASTRTTERAGSFSG